MRDGEAFILELGRLMARRVEESLDRQHANLSLIEEKELVDLALERLAGQIFQHFYGNDWL